jgi:hypothetical protein
VSAVLAADGGRVYPIDRGTRGLLLFCATGFAAFALGFIGYAVFSLRADQLQRWFVASGLLFLVATAATLALALKSATVLYPDRVEGRGAFGRRSIRKENIAGFRTISGRNEPPHMRLVSKQAGVRALNVYRFQPDTAFDDWFKDIPDLEAADVAALESNPALGASPAIRKAQSKLLHRYAYGLAAASTVACLWTLLRPHPYSALIWVEVLLPLIGLGMVAWSKGAITLIGLGGEGAPQVCLIFFASGLALAVRAFDYPIARAELALIGGALVGASLALLAWRYHASTMNRFLNSGTMLLVGVIYGYSLIVNLDRVLDNSRVHVHYGYVHDKYTSGARSIEYKLAVQPYGYPVPGRLVFIVREATYNEFSKGQVSCMGAHRGAFGIMWYDLRRCNFT